MSRKTLDDVARLALYSEFVGAMAWLHQGQGRSNKGYRTSVQSGRQEVGPLLHAQVQESPLYEAQAPGVARSLGRAAGAAMVDPLVARAQGGGERSGRHAI